MKLGVVLNEVRPDFHLVRARWTPGFIRFGRVWSTRSAVLAVPAWLKSYFWGPRCRPRSSS